MLRETPFTTDAPGTVHIKILRRIGFVYGAIAAAVFTIAGVVVLSQPLLDTTAAYAADSPPRAVR
jgi:hypothetical protein